VKPDDLAAAVGRALDTTVMSLSKSGSSGFSSTYRAALENGRTVFVKARSHGPAGMYRAEADGLAWLAETRAVRVPEALAVHDPDAAASESLLDARFLVLTWIDQQLPAPDHDDQLGRDLARLHRVTEPAFGLAYDNFIADLPQSNPSTASWAEFYGQHRLAPMLRMATDSGYLPREATALVDRVIERLPELIGPPEPPARLHGDLWRGNVLAGMRGEPWFIDPAVYAGHREMDLAMMRLFGGFGERCFEAYQEAYPLADGHRERIALYQLYPLLVHVVLFGSGYASSVMHAARTYA
jgi:fructosamine-3-kinase